MQNCCCTLGDSAIMLPVFAYEKDANWLLHVWPNTRPFIGEGAQLTVVFCCVPVVQDAFQSRTDTQVPISVFRFIF